MSGRKFSLTDCLTSGLAVFGPRLGAVVVHPEQREVFPLAPEPIVKGDGATKNDCERNAAKRLLGAEQNICRFPRFV